MSKFLRTTVIATSVVLVGAAASVPSFAAHRGAYRGGTIVNSYSGDRDVYRGASRAFDGSWSVVLETTRGSCPAAVRAGVRILGGRVLGEDQSYDVSGRVAPSGMVQVRVSANGQGGDAFGRLSRVAGRGQWQTWSGECAGEWTAARRD
jgi:hypothetical protein